MVIRRLQIGELSEERRAKSPRGGEASQKDKDKDEEDSIEIRTMIGNLQKLGLQTIQTQRELAGSLFTTGLVPIATRWAKAGVEAGKQYFQEVKTAGAGHNLGPPFPHVAVAITEMMLTLAKEWSEAGIHNAEDETNHTFLRELMHLLAPTKEGFEDTVVMQIFTHCSAREVWPRKGKGKGKGKDKGDKDMEVDDGSDDKKGKADRILIQVGLNALCPHAVGSFKGVEVAAKFRMILLHLISTCNGEVCQGPGPPIKSERKVRDDHRRLTKSQAR